LQSLPATAATVTATVAVLTCNSCNSDCNCCSPYLQQLQQRLQLLSLLPLCFEEIEEYRISCHCSATLPLFSHFTTGSARQHEYLQIVQILAQVLVTRFIAVTAVTTSKKKHEKRRKDKSLDCDRDKKLCVSQASYTSLVELCVSQTSCTSRAVRLSDLIH
jgi:hypothetical protein